MINIQHLLKVTAIWTTIVYIVCFLGVAIFPGIREWFMLYAMHIDILVGESIMTIITFITGLIIWNIIAFLTVGLFAALFNKIKE